IVALPFHLQRIRAGRDTASGEADGVAHAVAGELNPLAAARIGVGLDRGGRAAAGEGEAFGFEGDGRATTAAGVDRVGRAGHAAVGEAAFVCDGFERGGGANIDGAGVDRADGFARRAAIRRVTDGRAAGRRGERHALRAGEGAGGGTERRRG